MSDIVDDPTSPFSEIIRVGSTSPYTRDFPFAMGDVLANFRRVRKYPESYFRKIDEVREKAGEFTDSYIRPAAADIEKKVSEDPNYFAWDIMKKACDYRFFSMLIPNAFDGLDMRSVHMAVMVEEMAVGCAGIASTIGVHSAGISCGMLSLDPYILEKYIRYTAREEKVGNPVLWSGAVTEPWAGTDIWDEDFLEKAKIVTYAKKVKKGYVLSGQKCFISNGSVAKYCVVAAALDKSNIRESWTTFLVPLDSKGFSVGRVEKKMGQKASPAAEMVFDEVFIPRELLIGEEGKGGHNISIYLAGSRGPVGAIGTGCARRALESLIEWAKVKKTDKGRLIDQQGIQMTIARMAKEIVLARQAYMNSAIACDEIIEDIMRKPSIKAIMNLLPGAFTGSAAGKAIMKSKPIRNYVNKILDKAAPDDRLAQVSALATIAKVKGSDVGVKVSGEAMRIMGHDAADPRWAVDKCYRDAKLTQIYEGTNQANTITLFKDMVRGWSLK